MLTYYRGVGPHPTGTHVGLLNNGSRLAVEISQSAQTTGAYADSVHTETHWSPPPPMRPADNLTVDYETGITPEHFSPVCLVW